jgi:hypothetical protein
MSAPPEPTEPPAEGSHMPGVGDASMRAAIVAVFIFGLCFAVIGFALMGIRVGFGVLVGGAVATVNLLVFARVGQALMDRKGNTAPWGAVAVLKLILLFGGVWLVLESGIVSALSLAAGYAALPFGITFASLFGPKPPDVDLPPIQTARRGEDVIKGLRAGEDNPDGGSEP